MKFLVLLLSILFLTSCNNDIGIIGGADGPTSIIVSEKSLDDMVSNALLSNNKGKYADGECIAEGHIILGSDVKDKETFVYALTMYGEYGFQDNNFVKVSGSGTIPAVIVLSENDELNRIDWPEDGSKNVESIKELFPKEYHSRVLSIKDKDTEELEKQEKAYAQNYLSKIGRQAEIGDYGDFEHPLLTHKGVSVQVSNMLLAKNYANFPHWIGNQEKIEDGIRYVYEMNYDKENNQIILEKYNYETKEVVEKIRINSLNGDEVTLQKVLTPTGFAGSSFNRIELYKNGDIYWIQYDGAGVDYENIVKNVLVATNAKDIEMNEDEGIKVIGENINIIEDVKIGWLKFSNDNQEVILKNCTGTVATDNVYYYYNGVSNGKNVIYRVSVKDTTNPQIIHEIPDSDMSKTASFSVFDGDIYIKYSVGSGPTMSTEYNYKIEADGSLTKQRPGNYSGGKHGYSEITKSENGIFMKGVNEYFDSATKITYTVDGLEKEAEPISGRVQIGRKRNGKQDYNVNSKHEYIQIYNSKIYYTGIDLDTNNDSALYCLDTITGKTQKILDGVWGFHIYNGWSNEKQADSTMIVYDSNGSIMRYEELTGKTSVVEKCNEENMVLLGAVGDYCVYTIQKTLEGDRTIVKVYSDYANGYGSINGNILLDTKIGTYVGFNENKIVVEIAGKAEDGTKVLVISDGNIADQFRTTDMVSGIFIYNDTLLYKIADNKIVKFELKK
ncbi:MAG: sodium ion-translocating decarboxylase subunit beta [Clostridiales bacterium]|nr:sodium ion-translocating decarboxylase subunit beta [Clostridiales bacterium]